MGCDIHLQVEIRDGDEWKRVPHPERDCDSCDGTEARCWRCKGTGRFVNEFYDDRNYDVFAILADVRNGYGFAGVDTGDGFVPIDEPRGLPEDLSDEIAENVRNQDEREYGDPQWFWMGDHSHSWLTVAEILAYDWTRTTKKRGWVAAEEFGVFEREGKPSSWSGGVAGGGVEHISNQEMRRRIAEGTVSGDIEFGVATLARPSYFTLVEWEVPYTDPAEHFLQILHRDIVPLGKPADVRLVFGFDS